MCQLLFFFITNRASRQNNLIGGFALFVNKSKIDESGKNPAIRHLWYLQNTIIFLKTAKKIFYYL